MTREGRGAVVAAKAAEDIELRLDLISSYSSRVLAFHYKHALLDLSLRTD